MKSKRGKEIEKCKQTGTCSSSHSHENCIEKLEKNQAVFLG